MFAHREAELHRREKEFAHREAELHRREKEFAHREAELHRREEVFAGEISLAADHKRLECYQVGFKHNETELARIEAANTEFNILLNATLVANDRLLFENGTYKQNEEAAQRTRLEKEEAATRRFLQAENDGTTVRFLQAEKRTATVRFPRA